jgi:hypothetical protein
MLGAPFLHHSAAIRYTCSAIDVEDAAASDRFEVACEDGLKQKPGHGESARSFH